MDKMEFYNSELERAKTILWKTTFSKNLEHAKAARRILKDKKLLIEYVELRIEKKRKAEQKERRAMFWNTLLRRLTFRS